MISKRSFNRKKVSIVQKVAAELTLIFEDQLRLDGVKFDRDDLKKFIERESKELVRRMVRSIYREVTNDKKQGAATTLETIYLEKLKANLGAEEFARYDAF